MNKQENWFATKVEVCEMLENIKTLNDKVDKFATKAEVCEMLDNIKTLNDKVDKLIKMVELIDFVKVKSTSEFASSSFRFPSPNSDWSLTPGLPEPEVTEVPEVTRLSV